MGGTLLVSRSTKNQVFYKQKLEGFGFSNVTVTALDKDALNSLIRNIKPDNFLVGARFWERSTPYMMGRIKRSFPKLKMNMAALSLENYPPEIAMWFHFNGIQSFDTAFDGFEQFFMGLEVIRKGIKYISPSVQERIDIREIEPDPADEYTERQTEVMHLMCCGWKDEEIADNLHISRKTVNNHKTNIFTMLNVRNPTELMGVVKQLDIASLEEIHFYPKTLILNPKPSKEKNQKKKIKTIGGRTYDFKN